MQYYPKHYCGVFGVYGHPNAAELTYYGLFALQHRGQESAGIVTCDGRTFYKHLGIGLMAIAHNGNLTNAAKLRDELEAKGQVFQTTVDSEIIVHLLAQPSMGP